MDRYDYAVISATGNTNGIRIQCTDSAAVEELIRDLTYYYPKLQLGSTMSLPSQKTYFWYLKNLSSEDNQAKWWLIQQLCHRGWEPLGAASEVMGEMTTTYLHYQFRRKQS